MKRIQLAVLGLMTVATAVAVGVVALRSSEAPVEAHSPHPGLDFSIGVGDVCDSTSGPPVCEVAAGATFTLEFRLNSTGGVEYIGYDSYLQFSGVTIVEHSLVQTGASVWPGCVLAANVVRGRSLGTVCAYGIGASASSYTGVMNHVDFTCPEEEASGYFTLLAGHAKTDILDEHGGAHSDAANEALTITCGDSSPDPPPTATPTPHGDPSFAIGVDVDGDGDNDCGTGVPLAVGDGAPDPVPVEVTNTECVAEADAALDVRVYLMDNGGVAYYAAESAVRYGGLGRAKSVDSIWSGCALRATSPGPNVASSGCSLGIGASSVSSVGAFMRFDLSCQNSASLALDHNVTSLYDAASGEYSELGVDELSVQCGDRPTLPPPTATPTATPKPTSTPCLSCPSPQFALGVDVDGDGHHDCGTGVPRRAGDGAPDAVSAQITNTTCTGSLGEPLTVNVYLIDNAGIAYTGQESILFYDGITSGGRGTATWEGCEFKAAAYAPHPGDTRHFEAVGCVIGIQPASKVEHVGVVTRFAFTCSDDGTLSLHHGPAETYIITRELTEYWEQGGEDRLEVVCEVVTVGDASCSGGVDSIDAALILQYAAGLLAEVPCPDGADANEDATIDARDARLVLHLSAGLLSGFR